VENHTEVHAKGTTTHMAYALPRPKLINNI